MIIFIFLKQVNLGNSALQCLLYLEQTCDLDSTKQIHPHEVFNLEVNNLWKVAPCGEHFSGEDCGRILPL